MEHGLLLGVALVEVEAAGGLAAFQMSSKLLQPCSLGGGPLVVAALCSLGHPACAVLDDLEVGEDQLIVDGVDVRDGVHGLGLGHILHDMDDVVVVKATHHMDDGVALADVAEEFVAEACALTCALHEARDVHELHDGGGLLVGLPDLSQLVQPLVGHGHDAAVRLDGAEGIVCGLRVLGGGDGIEQSGLADVGQADDTKFHIKYAPSRLIDILIHLSLYAKERRSARVNPSVCSDNGRSSPPRSRAAPPPR